MALHRRSFLKLAGIAGTGSAFGVCAPAIVRAATPIKLTLPWLPLGTYSFTFAAKKLGYWEKRGLDVTIDRGFGYDHANRVPKLRSIRTTHTQENVRLIRAALVPATRAPAPWCAAYS